MTTTRAVQDSTALLVELLRHAADAGVTVTSAAVGQDGVVLRLDDEAAAELLGAHVLALGGGGIARRMGTTLSAYRFGWRLDHVVAPGDVHTAMLEVAGLDRKASPDRRHDLPHVSV